MQRVSATSKRIDVVFDVYREKSFKNTQREERGDTQESSNIQPDDRIKQWRNPQNKKQLVRVVRIAEREAQA